MVLKLKEQVNQGPVPLKLSEPFPGVQQTHSGEDDDHGLECTGHYLSRFAY